MKLCISVAIVSTCIVAGCTSLHRKAFLTCINNVRILDNAKCHFAVRTNVPTHTVVTPDQIKKYIKGEKWPICPSGGQYRLHPLGEWPECSVHGKFSKDRVVEALRNE